MMGVENYNLQFILAKAENAQAFQNQYLILDRALALSQVQREGRTRKHAEESVAETEEMENLIVDPDGKEGSHRHRPRRRRLEVVDEVAPTFRRRPIEPSGEGSLLDVLA